MGILNKTLVNEFKIHLDIFNREYSRLELKDCKIDDSSVRDCNIYGSSLIRSHFWRLNAKETSVWKGFLEDVISLECTLDDISILSTHINNLSS
jgi:hypothetical protein